MRKPCLAARVNDLCVCLSLPPSPTLYMHTRPSDIRAGGVRAKAPQLRLLTTAPPSHTARGRHITPAAKRAARLNGPKASNHGPHTDPAPTKATALTVKGHGARTRRGLHHRPKHSPPRPEKVDRCVPGSGAPESRARVARKTPRIGQNAVLPATTFARPTFKVPSPSNQLDQQPQSALSKHRRRRDQRSPKVEKTSARNSERPSLGTPLDRPATGGVQVCLL